MLIHSSPGYHQGEERISIIKSYMVHIEIPGFYLQHVDVADQDRAPVIKETWGIIKSISGLVPAIYSLSIIVLHI